MKFLLLFALVMVCNVSTGNAQFTGNASLLNVQEPQPQGPKKSGIRVLSEQLQIIIQEIQAMRKENKKDQNELIIQELKAMRKENKKDQNELLFWVKRLTCTTHPGDSSVYGWKCSDWGVDYD